MSSAQPSMPEMMTRLRQQELLAHVGLVAIKQDSLDAVLAEACRIAAEGMGTTFAKVLEHDPAQGDLLVRAGVGWRPGVVGQVRLGADLASPAGYALRTGKPVISNHLGNETRFRTPPLLTDHGINQAINVVIQGEGDPYGVLEVDSSQRAAFEAQDVPFLQALAGMLGVLIEKHARQAAAAVATQRMQGLLAASLDGVVVLDGAGVVETANPSALAMMGLTEAATLAGQPWEQFWPAEARPALRDALAAAQGGAPSRFEAAWPGADGSVRWWDTRILPEGGRPGTAAAGDGQAAGAGQGRLVAVSRDVTQAVQEARNKDLLIQEVHHRVRNSLQLVQNLLTLQARASGDPTAQTQLQESAARVNTIGAIHDRLYQAGTGLDVPVEPYLRGLLDDVQAGMASTLTDRPVRLDSDSLIWPAAEVTTLGLVTVELVTNALKYGAGTVTVTLRQPPGEAAVLVVEDEGVGLAGGPMPSRSAGLGMRLVQGLLRGPAGLELDRSIANTRFIARLPGPAPS